MFAPHSFRRIGLGVLLAVCLAAGPAAAAPPPAAKLLPKETSLVVTIHNVGELSKRFMNTGIGRMSQDPELKPLIKKLYGIAGEAVALVKEQIGVSLDEMLAIPQGEVTFALVTPEDKRTEMVFFLDAGEQIGAARTLLGKAVELYQQNEKVNRHEETVGQTKLVAFTRGDRNRPRGAYFEREGMICIAQNMDRLKAVLTAWDGLADETLTDNPRYATVVSRCTQGLSEPPQFFFYADPIAIAKAIIRDQPGNRGARVAMAMLPTLGLDGLHAVGMSTLLDSGPMDSVTHAHILLDNPRTGVLDVLAFEPHDMKPGAWVPKDVANYMSVQWDFNKSLKKVGVIVDSFTREGYFSEVALGEFRRDMGLDMEKEILPTFDGRVTMIQRVQEPITINSQHTLVAFRLKDPKRFAKVFDKLMDEKKEVEQNRVGWRKEKKSFGGKTYYQFSLHFPNEFSLEAEQLERMPHPCMGVIDNQFIISNQQGIFMAVLRTVAEEDGSLADEPDFKLIAGKIARLSGGRKPSMIQFDRPEETMRYLYGLLTSDRARGFLRQGAENNPYLKSIDGALDEHPFPPFSVIRKYLAPGGGFVIDDETGIHLTGFALRRKQSD
ncbi:MAG: hypothetical protein JW818_07305 [Pirellulales bacterium]|nr:hypothetical protein [Pirellulales bacterium]